MDGVWRTYGGVINCNDFKPNTGTGLRVQPIVRKNDKRQSATETKEAKEKAEKAWFEKPRERRPKVPNVSYDECEDSSDGFVSEDSDQGTTKKENKKKRQREECKEYNEKDQRMKYEDERLSKRLRAWLVPKGVVQNLDGSQ